MKVSDLNLNNKVQTKQINEATDYFPNVDLIKIDPDRADSYDIVSALLPTLVKIAYVDMSHDKVKYDRTHNDEEDTPFDFSESELVDRLDNVINQIRNRLDDMSAQDKKAFINRVKSDFITKLDSDNENF